MRQRCRRFRSSPDLRTLQYANTQRCRSHRDLCIRTVRSSDPLTGRIIMRKLLTFGLASVLLVVPFAASAQEAYTTRSVNVRAGPDTSYPVVGSLGAGAPVEVFGCIDDWSWCDVGFGYDRGWVYAPYLNYVYQGRRVPFYTYAPTFGIP